jgi:hypothetical protein
MHVTMIGQKKNAYHMKGKNEKMSITWNWVYTNLTRRLQCKVDKPKMDSLHT